METMSKLDQLLENCLQALELGDTVETVVSRYPEFADELRPILETVVRVKNKNMFGVSPIIVRRNRAKLLQHAAEMREGKFKRSSRGVWLASLRRVAVTLIVLMVVFASGTGLVRASSSTVPGDRLYPVKRTWENVLVFATFDVQQREVLELEQENKRLEELQELFEKGRSVSVDFSGLVTTQNADQWSVSGINVLISPQTRLSQEFISVGTGVHVVGHAQHGFVQAESIELISLNEVSVESAVSSTSIPAAPAYGDNPGLTPEIEVTGSASTPESEATAVVVNPVETAKPFEPRSKSFRGIVQSMSGSIWIINGVQVNVDKAEISGKSVIGAVAKVEGYFDQAGVFIAKRIELRESQSGNDNSSEVAAPSSTPGSQYEGNDDHHDDGYDHVTETPEYHDDYHQTNYTTKTPEPNH
jgi:hypothetical protein